MYADNKDKQLYFHLYMIQYRKMIYKGKFTITGSLITACDYSFILKQITSAIKYRKRLLISPIASQTLVRAKQDHLIRRALAQFDFLVPDSEWIKRSLNFLYRLQLKKRVYGPQLMLEVCGRAEKMKWRIYLYGTNKNTLHKLKNRLILLYPQLLIVGINPSLYRPLIQKEVSTLQKKIQKSKAHIVFIGTGSPQQELLTYQLVTQGNGLNKVIIPEGAAFDFISITKPQAPLWMQNNGIEWFFRLTQEPMRLWYRYLVNGPLFALLLCQEYIAQNILKIKR